MSHWLSRHHSAVRSSFEGRSFRAGNMQGEVVVFDNSRQVSRSSWGRRVVQVFINLVLAISLVVLGVTFAPKLYYFLLPVEVVPLRTQEPGTPLGGSFAAAQTAKRQVATPQFNSALPKGNWVVIPKIGVRTQLLSTSDPTEALNKGVWQVPDFGVPGDQSKPMILVAHRFGLKIWWESNYWKYHTFYLLPQLQPGDRVEVISEQRKWLYEVYAGEEGAEITDYSADLILYTCKYLNSPLRHFRYARLIDPGAGTQ